MGSGARGGEEVRGAPGGRAVDRKRVVRLAVVGVIAIVAVVFLAPQIREARDETFEQGDDLPEGIDIFTAAVVGDVLFGLGADFGDGGYDAKPSVFRYDGDWKPVLNFPEVEYLSSIGASDELIVVTGRTESSATVVTAHPNDLEWESEHVALTDGELRSVVVVGNTIVAAATKGVVVRRDGDWHTATLPGSEVISTVTATPTGFVAGGRANGAAAMWASTDGLIWSALDLGGVDGYLQHLVTDDGGRVVGVGTVEQRHVVFVADGERYRTIDLPVEDAGEAPMGIVFAEGRWLIPGFDIDVGEGSRAIAWRSDASATSWTLDERIAADRLTDALVIDGRPFGVGSLERGGKLTPVLVPL